MVDVPTISIAIAAASVVAGVIYYSLQLRHQTKARQTDLVWRIYSDLNRKEFLGAWTKTINLEFKEYSDLVKRYGQLFSGKPVTSAIFVVANLFEGVGVLLHRKLVDIGVVADLLPVEMTWEKMKPIVGGMRKQFNDPRFYEWFEYLYNEMKKREQQLPKTWQNTLP